MQQLVENMRRAYGERIDALTWMTAGNQGRGARKAAHLPSEDRLSGQVARLFARSRSAPATRSATSSATRVYEWNYDQSRASTSPTDRDEWFMTPQTVNAYYNPTLNEIVFPAAILQPPFFDPNADPAVNYGGIGGVIGHEMGHGFDDQGAKSDAQGVLRDWWSPADVAAFTRAGRPSSRRNTTRYAPLPGIHVNGRLTLGENIGDNGGLQVAHYAYHISLNGQTRAGDRRLHRRSALLPRLGAGLARAHPRRGAAQSDHDRPALAAAISLQRRRAQHRRLVRGVQRAAGRRALSGAGRSAC